MDPTMAANYPDFEKENQMTKCDHFDEIINSTYTSSRDCIEGYFIFDCVKNGWFKVLKSRLVFISFNYSFGFRWPKKHHEILEVEKCNKKQSDYLLNCHKKVFITLNA